MAAVSQQSDDDLINGALGGGAPPAVSQPPTSAPQQSDDDLIAGALGTGAGAVPATPAAAASAPTAPIGSALWHSIEQGGRNINITADQAENWLRGNVPGFTYLSNAAGYDPNELARLQQQTREYYQSPDAARWFSPLVRGGTEMAIAAPMLGPLADMVPAAGPGARFLARAPGAAARGAIYGGGTNLLASGGSGQNPLVATGEGAAGGAVLGPVAEGIGGAASRLLGRAAPAATPAAESVPPAGTAPEVQLNPMGSAAATSGPYAPSTPAEVAAIPDALPPLRLPVVTQAGANSRADDIIRHFAANGPTQPDMRELVPGSTGTLAQITGNAGLATLERAVRNVPDVKNIFDQVDAAQQASRRTALASLVGTPEDLAQLQATRDAATTDLRNQAFANTTPTDPSAAVGEIDRVLASPAGKRPGISGPLGKLRSLFYDSDGNLETDPAMLYGVRQAITDSLSPLSRGTENDARAAASQLQPVLTNLDQAIEQGAPGYRGYMDEFRQQSGPIDAMTYLQNRNLTDPYGNTTLAKLDSTIKDIDRQRAMPGARNADNLSDDQLTTLKNLRDDMRRSGNLAKGKALGSNTVENLAGSQALNMLTRPATDVAARAGATWFGGPGGYLAAAGAHNALTGAAARSEKMVQQALVDRLLNRGGLGVRALSQGAGQ